MNIVMIGGSTGIGYEYYKKAKSRGDKVVVLSRTQHEVADSDWKLFDVLDCLDGGGAFPDVFESIDALI